MEALNLAAADIPIAPQQLILLAGIVLIIVLLSINARRRRREMGPSPRDYVREHVARLRDQQAVKNDIETLMLQLEELARELNAQIDTRFAKLETAIRHADERIATLERLLRTPIGQPSVDVAVGDEQAAEPAEVCPTEPTPPTAPEPSAEAVQSAPSPSRNEDETLRPLTKGGKPTHSGASQTTPPSPQRTRAAAGIPDPDRDAIYAMADAGKQPVEIAQALGRPTGEIELVLALRGGSARSARVRRTPPGRPPG